MFVYFFFYRRLKFMQFIQFDGTLAWFIYLLFIGPFY